MKSICMHTRDFLKADYEDILFENRNKRYGAYLLRKLYPRHLNEAFLITLLLFILLFGMPLMCSNVNHSAVSIPAAARPKGIFTIYLPPPVSVPKSSAAKASVVQKTANPKLAPVIKSDQDTKALIALTDNSESIPMISGIKAGASVASGLISGPSIDREVAPSTGGVHFATSMPSFPGGEKALAKYLQNHLQYPSGALGNNIEGKVSVQFIVDENGNISDIRILRDIGGGCGDEAVRVIRGMPAWQPGKQNGQPVSVYLILPVTFQVTH